MEAINCLASRSRPGERENRKRQNVFLRVFCLMFFVGIFVIEKKRKRASLACLEAGLLGKPIWMIISVERWGVVAWADTKICLFQGTPGVDPTGGKV